MVDVTPFERAARAHIASRGSPGTRSLYALDLDRWLVFCRDRGHDAEAPTLEVATAYRDDLVARYASLTVRRVMSALASMYEAAGIYSAFKSSRQLQRPSADDAALTREFTIDEADRLIAAALWDQEDRRTGLRDAALMQLLRDTGLRVGSAVRLKRSQIFRQPAASQMLQGSEQTFIDGIKVKKRGRVKVEVPARAAERLDAWLAVAPESEWVFPAARGDGPLTAATVNRRMLVHGKRAKVDHPHPHRFRTSFATEALDAGVPLKDVQAAMHHADPKTTLRYDRGTRGAGVTAAVAAYRDKQRGTK